MVSTWSSRPTTSSLRNQSSVDQVISQYWVNIVTFFYFTAEIELGTFNTPNWELANGRNPKLITISLRITFFE